MNAVSEPDPEKSGKIGRPLEVSIWVYTESREKSN
jgi:hypothetical protein